MSLAYKFNAVTGQLDLVDIFDPNTILTVAGEVLVDENGNILIGE